MASADGSYAFNTTLSRNRANSAKNWLVDQLHISASQASRFSVGSRPEGWMPVLQAMIADGHPDSLKVREILDKYNAENDDVQNAISAVCLAGTTSKTITCRKTAR